MSSPLPVSATDKPVSASDKRNVVQIRVVGFTGQDIVRELPVGDALVIGCSPACGLRLKGAGIAGLHCTISYDEAGLTIEDWDTEIGTYVNGERVPSRLVIEPGTALKIGDYQVLTEAVVDKSPPPEADTAAPREHPHLSEVSLKDLKDLLVEDVTPAVETPAVDDPGPEGDVASQEDETASQDDGADDLGNAWDSPFDEISKAGVTGESAHAGYARGELEDNTAELLQVEVEFLRTELAERDARIAELEEFASCVRPAQDEELPSREEVETLVERLEQLLGELEQSDERISTMSELLRMSDEANVASQEELAQMESWIGEVERRVRQWEEEWHAERDVMEKSIADLTDQRDRAETRGGTSDQTELINELREHAATLQSQLQQTQSERDELNQRLEAANVGSIEERIAKEIEAAMREERLQISQLKAEYARERAELAKQREDIMLQQSSSTSEPDVADVRIRAFREHLKEIKATEPSGRPAPTLSARLGKLWRKIDGKPLDTD